MNTHIHHRGRMWKRAAIATTAASAFVVLAACGGSSSSPTTDGSSTAAAGTPVAGGTLTVNIATAPSTLDPILGGSGGDHFSLYPIFDRLVNLTSDAQPAPGLAKSWEFPDPKTLVLHLQEGVTFSDGTAFNAAAVKYNLDRARTLKTSTEVADLSPISSIDATDDSTVTIHLSAPDSALPLILADRSGMMGSPAAIKSEGDKFGLKPVGTGPFVVSSYAPGSELDLTKNPTYWQKGKPYLDGVKITYLTDGQTAVNSVLSGQTDFASQVAPQYAQNLDGNSNITVSSAPSLLLNGLYINAGKAPFNNTDARLALQAAVDPKAVSTALYFGKGEPASQLFPSSYWAYQQGLPTSLYDPDKAKQLAESSGLTKTTVQLLYYTAPGEERFAQIVQSELKAIGVKSTVTGEVVGTGVSDFYTDKKFNVFVSGWSGRPDPGQTLSSLLSPKGYYNAGAYQGPGTDVDGLIAATQAASDTAARSAAIKPLAEYNQAQAVFIPLAFAPDVVVMSKKVGGFSSVLTGKDDVSFLWLNK